MKTTLQRTCSRSRMDQLNNQKLATSNMTNKARSGVSTPIGRRECASIASANLMAISMNVRPMSSPKTEKRNSKSVMATPVRHCGRGQTSSEAGKGGSRRPGTKSLWLLPSGPDQVGDSAVRRLPSVHMGTNRLSRKREREEARSVREKGLRRRSVRENPSPHPSLAQERVYPSLTVHLRR